MVGHIVEVLAKAALGGLLVVAFAMLAETLSPKRFAGVFAAAPSVALASLLVSVLAKGPKDAADDCAGMVAGAAGFVAYCLVAPPSMSRWGSRKGAGAALGAWLAAAACVMPLTVATLTGGKLSGSAALGAARNGDGNRPRLEYDPGRLRKAKPKDWLIRFGFGAGTSAGAGVISIGAGPVIGGAFLAFPAILLASLTLVAEEEGAAQARDDARGGTFGAVGLLAFALCGARLYARLPTPAVFGLVAVAWTVVALGCYGLGWLAGFGNDERP